MRCAEQHTEVKVLRNPSILVFYPIQKISNPQPTVHCCSMKYGVGVGNVADFHFNVLTLKHAL